MLNYLQAELWRVFRRKSLYVQAAFLLSCAHFFAFLYSNGDFPQLVSGVCTTMITGILAAPMLAQLVDAGFQDTVKNELSFGLSRSSIYLGKLAGGIVLGLLFCGVLVGGVLLSGWLFLSHGTAREYLTALGMLTFCLTAALPLWCGMLSLCHMLGTLIRSAGVWVTLYFTVFFFGQPLIAAVLGNHIGRFDLFQAVLAPYSLLLSGYLSGNLDRTPGYLFLCWAVGLGWLAATTIVGLLCFHYRETRS